MVRSTQPRGVPQEAGASSSCCCFLGPLRGSSIEVHSVFGSGGHHEAEQCSLVLRMRIRETRKGRTVWLALGSSGHHIGSHNSEVQLGLYQCCPLALSLSHYSRFHSKPLYSLAAAKLCTGLCLLHFLVGVLPCILVLAKMCLALC
jgi:hypothetical protein